LGLKAYAQSVYKRSLVNSIVGRVKLSRAPGRELNARELTVLRGVFGDAVDYSAVKIKERPFKKETQQGATSYNTIMHPIGRPLSDATLVHEVVHVWQSQQGKLKYAWNIKQQPSKYDARFRDAILVGKKWGKLSFEHQAWLIEEAFERGYFDSNAHAYDREPLVKAALKDAEAAFERSEERLLRRMTPFQAVA
jgi:hypothetical protein